MSRPSRSPWELLALHVILQAAQDARSDKLHPDHRLAAAGWLAEHPWAQQLAEFAGLDAQWIRSRARELLASLAGEPRKEVRAHGG